jgi:hypothetical protein
MSDREYEFFCPRCGHCCQQREWIGLTDEEIENLWEMAQAWNAPKHFYILIAAKLKEKNA